MTDVVVDLPDGLTHRCRRGRVACDRACGEVGNHWCRARAQSMEHAKDGTKQNCDR